MLLSVTMPGMIPNITRGSNPSGLVKYLFGKGRKNEHTDQHLVCSSRDMADLFDDNGQPVESFESIGRHFDRRYRVLERKNEPFPPDRRGKDNPEHEHGKHRIWHCSLSIKAGQGILTDQEWEPIVRDYLLRMNIIENEDDTSVTWLAIRHGLSTNGNDHIHIMVQLATDRDWINPFRDRIHAQQACRRMEQERPELVELARSNTSTRIAWQYHQWRQWAEWKARYDYGDDQAWDELDSTTRSRLVTQISADTMPRQYVARVVEACAIASHSEDEFIRRVRREGFNIDPRMRKGVNKDTFNQPEQVVGYKITWRSRDGWTERFNAFELGSDMRLKALRSQWANDQRSRSLTVQEWRAAMENRPPFLNNGRERHVDNLSTHDMERLVSQAFHIAMSLDHATDTSEYHAAIRDGLRTFDLMRERYGLPDTNIPMDMTWTMEPFIPLTGTNEQETTHNH